ncbi:MAG: TolC family protein [Pseudohongiella sp.]|nr:TolC family protein [Pseudohongiella sp.]
MYLLKSGLLSLLLFMTACQSASPARYQTHYAEYERSARAYLEPKITGAGQHVIKDSDPLSTDIISTIASAQQLALQRSPRIASIFVELGIHEADVVQQRLRANPGMELSLMRPDSGGRWQMEFSVSLGLLDWLSRQRRIALAETEQARWQAQAWRLLHEELGHVRSVWLHAVAAQQKLQIHRELHESATVAADFAGVLFEAGNISELELLSNQSIADQRQAQLMQAEFDAIKARNQLQQSLGLAELENISVPERLPSVTQHAADSGPPETERLMQLAREHQPALQLMQFEQQQKQAALALAVRRTGLRGAGLELITERESSGERQHGFALSVEAPVFDNGDTQLSVMQGQLQLALIQQQMIEAEIRTGIRTSLQEIWSSLQQLNLLNSDELPRLQRMMALSVQEYNFMLRGTFDLLAIADLMLDARMRQVNASEQYWRSYSTLENLIGTQIQESTND